MLKGFRDFMLRGNAIDLAVGVIIGAAFSGIVTALSEGLLTPLIGVIFGQPDFSSWNVGPFAFGNILNAIVSFLMTAFVLYFFIVVPMNNLNAHLKRDKSAAPPPPPPATEQLLSEIRDLQKQQLAALQGNRSDR